MVRQPGVASGDEAMSLLRGERLHVSGREGGGFAFSTGSPFGGLALPGHLTRPSSSVVGSEAGPNARRLQDRAAQMHCLCQRCGHGEAASAVWAMGPSPNARAQMPTESLSLSPFLHWDICCLPGGVISFENNFLKKNKIKGVASIYVDF